MAKPYQGEKIVLFDGVCILCNRSVDFLLDKDHKRRLKFASLQSGFAKTVIQNHPNHPLNEDTIIFYDEGRIYTKSTAVLKISAYLSLPYSALAVFLIIPRTWRDLAYDKIAMKRAKWFGTRSNCRVPDQNTIGRIIE